MIFGQVVKLKVFQKTKQTLILANELKIKGVDSLYRKNPCYVIGIPLLIMSHLALARTLQSTPYNRPVPYATVCMKATDSFSQNVFVTGSIQIDTPCSVKEFLSKYSRFPLPAENLSETPFFETYGFDKKTLYFPGKSSFLKVNGQFVFV